MQSTLFDTGNAFFVGCNYWASNAGTFMWRNWSPETVERDFRALSVKGVSVLRCFPLWPDFQPLTIHTQGAQEFREYRMGEEALPDTDAGQCGVDETMLERFRLFADLAERYDLKLIVGLVTGWMSGRMYVPPAFERRNVLTDPEVMRWQVRFVKCFVHTLKDKKAIVAWDWGNECNCMAHHNDSEMWLWGSAITAAIRSEDPSRPVVSGMHSPARSTLEAEAEAADVLCTHPYPTFTPHCRVDPLYSFRSAFHAAAETNYYRDLSGKEAFVEEFGTLGPTISSEKISRAYLRNLFWNCYSHGCHGALWWCANDQTELSQTPYQWTGMERELGLLKPDGTQKPILDDFADFADFAPKHPLPPRRIDAMVVLPWAIDEWGVGFISFLLAKQAGFDVRFQSCEKKLQPASFYIIPSAKGFDVMEKYRLQQLLQAIRDGATLLMTADGTLTQPVEPFGVEVETSFRAHKPLQLRIGNGADAFELPIERTIESHLNTVDADVLGTDQEGRPAFTCAAYGKGHILYLNAPLEAFLMDRPDSFGDNAPAFWRVYDIAAKRAGIRRIVRRDDPQVTLTEHPMADGTLAVVAVNNSATPRMPRLEIAGGWRVTSCHNGEWNAADSTLAAAPKSGALLYLAQNESAPSSFGSLPTA